MRQLRLWATSLALALLAVPLTTQAQNHDDHRLSGLRGEVLESIEQAEQKFVALAEAMPESTYDWRPAEGVRSVGEVFLHIAGNNYWLPTLLGINAPASSTITPSYNSVVAFETQTGKAAIVQALKDSFVHLKAAFPQVAADRLEEPMDVFGTPGTVRSYLILISTHMHEHMGQAIAYSRMTGITPPWSR